MKNSKQLCREVARKLDMPEKEVREQYMFLMQQFKFTLIGMKGPISMYHVGSFNVNYKKLCKNIRLMISALRFYRDRVDKVKISPTKRQLIVAQKTQLLRNLLRERNQQAIHRVNIRKYYATKKAERMDKQARHAAAHPEAPPPNPFTFFSGTKAKINNMAKKVSMDSRAKASLPDVSHEQPQQGRKPGQGV